MQTSDKELKELKPSNKKGSSRLQKAVHYFKVDPVKVIKSECPGHYFKKLPTGKSDKCTANCAACWETVDR